MKPSTPHASAATDQPDPTAARSRGVLVTLLFGLCFPIAWVVLIPYALLLVATYRMLAFSRDPRQYGNDATLPWEKLTALVVIPIVGLIATFGTGLGFYLLADHDHSHTEPALIVLVVTALVSVELVVLAVRDLSAHQRRTDVLPYEADVDPADGIAKLTRTRSQPGAGFLPGIWRTALAQADLDLAQPPEQNREPGVTRIRAAIRSERTSRIQWRCVVIMAVSWLVVAGLALPRGNHWRFSCALAILAGLAVLQLLLSLAISAIHLKWTYHLYLRQGRRIQVLQKRVDEADRSRRRHDVAGKPGNAPYSAHPAATWMSLAPHAIWAATAVASLKIWRAGLKG